MGTREGREAPAIGEQLQPLISRETRMPTQLAFSVKAAGLVTLLLLRRDTKPRQLSCFCFV